MFVDYHITQVYIPVSLGFSMLVDKNNISTSTGVSEVFHVCRLVYKPSTFTSVTEVFHVCR
jgi:hypothetical protein